MSLVTINSVIKRYSTVLAVDNISLKIDENEILGLVGPNGAGKSTTIKMMVGLTKPDTGSILIHNKDVQKYPIDVKKMIGLVPQDLAIYENISARENIKYFGSLYGIYGKKLDAHVDEALEFASLTEHQGEKPKYFSGGMKRRLNIACSLVHQPKIMIMDEPTVGIDTQSRNHILESVKELNRRGTTIIYTSHYMEEVASLCTRIGIIDNGKLIACNSKDGLKKLIHSEESIVIETLGFSGVPIHEIEKLNGVTAVSTDNNTLDVSTFNSQNNIQDILFILSKSNVAVKNISVKEPTLESVFLSLTGKTLRD